MYLWISFEAEGVNLPLDCLAQVEKFVDFVESWFDTRKAIGKFWLSLVLHMSYSELKEAFFPVLAPIQYLNFLPIYVLLRSSFGFGRSGAQEKTAEGQSRA